MLNNENLVVFPLRLGLRQECTFFTALQYSTANFSQWNKKGNKKYGDC